MCVHTCTGTEYHCKYPPDLVKVVAAIEEIEFLGTQLGYFKISTIFMHLLLRI